MNQQITRSEYIAYWRSKNPLKIRAHRAVFVAMRNGTLEKKNCFCGEKAQAHHEDYSRPLDVKWLCKKHHAIADKKRRIENNEKQQHSTIHTWIHQHRNRVIEKKQRQTKKQQVRPASPLNKMKKHLKEKQEELVWALSIQDYTLQDICLIFGIKHRMTVQRIIDKKPKNWVPKWHKI